MLACVAVLLPLGTATVHATSPSAAKPPKLLHRTGSATSPVDGGLAPARDLRKATLTIDQYFDYKGDHDVTAGDFRLGVDLGARPTSATDSRLWLALGTWNGSSCSVPADGYRDWVDSAEESAGGAHLALVGWAGDDYSRYTCAVVTTTHVDATSYLTGLYDKVSFDLKDVRAAARGQLGARRHPKDAVVYTRAWKKVRVTVRNPGTGPVRNIKVTAGGKGLKVRGKHRIAQLASGRKKQVSFRVRATNASRHQRNLLVRLKGRGPGAISRSAKLPLMTLPKGSRPRAGKYRGSSPSVSFTVTKRGKLKKFRLRFTGSCVGGGIFSDTMTLPVTAVNKFGWVVRTYHRGKGASSYVAQLRVRFKGNRATHGFYYHDAGLCSGSQKFSARRR